MNKVTRAELDLGNSRHGQAFRIANYLAGRSIDVPATARLRGLQDSFHLMPGDVVRIKHDAAPWTYVSGQPDFKSFEVLECSDAAADERDFLLQEYSAAIYSDTEEAGQALASPAIASREGVPGFVTGQAVSEGPTTTRDNQTVSTVTASFTPPAPRKNWAGVELWITGYRAGTQAVLVAAGGESPIKFDLESTNETITVYFVSVSGDGRRRAILTSPSATVLLDGQTSAPVPVSALAGQTGGELGQVVRLTWTENIEVDLDHYQIARRAAAAAVQGDITNADIIAAVAAAGVSASRKAAWDDAPGVSQGTRYYYVRAVNKTGLASAGRPDPPATLAIAHKAPDDSTDTSTPSNLNWPGTWNHYAGEASDSRVQAGAIVIEYIAPGSIPAADNYNGAWMIEWEMKTWSDIGGTLDAQIKKFQVAWDP
ncbi:MAG: hypothetical protein AAB368_11085, partial [bacterium]